MHSLVRQIKKERLLVLFGRVCCDDRRRLLREQLCRVLRIVADWLATTVQVTCRHGFAAVLALEAAVGKWASPAQRLDLPVVSAARKVSKVRVEAPLGGRVPPRAKSEMPLQGQARGGVSHRTCPGGARQGCAYLAHHVRGIARLLEQRGEEHLVVGQHARRRVHERYVDACMRGVAACHDGCSRR